MLTQLFAALQPHRTGELAFPGLFFSLAVMAKGCLEAGQNFSASFQQGLKSRLGDAI